MNKKSIKLTVKQNDLLEKKDQVIFNGIGQINMDNDLEIYYEETDKTKVRLRLGESGGFLMRKGEVLMQMNFDLHTLQQCKVTTSVGDIYMVVNTINIELEKNKVFLYYELSEAGAIVGKFELRLEWENE